MTIVEIKESILLALATLRAHKMRSFLTILGVLVGVFTIIAVVSIITGLNNSMANQIESLGSNVIYVSKFKPGIHMGGHRSASERNRKGITFEDGQAILKYCPAIVAMSPQNYYFRPGGNIVKYKDKEVRNPRFFGTLPDYELVNNTSVVAGRFFNDADDKFRNMVAVISYEIAEKLFENKDPIYKEILVNGDKFIVIGVLEKRDLLDSGENRNIAIPYGTYNKLHPEETELALSLKAATPEIIPEAVDQVTNLMRRQRGLKYNEPNNFAVFTQENLLEIYDQITKAIWFAMIVISSIGLLVGGVGVMNIMLVSVTERTKEIGIRKAIGAKRKNILWQFLIEAMVLSGFGGALGIISGLGVGQLIDSLTPLPADISVEWIIFAFCFSVGIALIFGIYPAAKASKLDPIESLRYE